MDLTRQDAVAALAAAGVAGGGAYLATTGNDRGSDVSLMIAYRIHTDPAVQ